MTPRATGLSWLALTALLPGLVGDGPGLGYHPDPGRALERRLRETTRFELDSMVERIGETELPDPLPGLTIRLERELEVVDTPASLEDGRALELRRRYVTAAGALELRAELGGDLEDYAADLESPLEGATATFAWDEDAESYRARFEDEEPADADELAAGLREDLDLRALLPDGEVAEGERWSVDFAGLADLLAPGGELALRFGYEPDGAYRLLSVEELTALSLVTLGDQRGELEGELEAAWTATREEEGARLAVIELALDATLEAQDAGRLGRRLSASGIDSERLDPELRTSWTLAGRGRLLWDLEAGVFRELELELEHTCRARFTWTQEFGGRELYYERELELSGETTLSGECR